MNCGYGKMTCLTLFPRSFDIRMNRLQIRFACRSTTSQNLLATPASLFARWEKDRMNCSGATSIGGTLCVYSAFVTRSEEHTSELQSRLHLVCRLLLEKKKKKPTIHLLHKKKKKKKTSKI